MKETYNRLKRLIGLPTEARADFINKELEVMGLHPQIFELDSPRGVDRHLMVQFDFGSAYELWLTANYDTFDQLPSGNNNSSSVTTLLGVVQEIGENQLPIGVRLVYFDAGLDTDLITKRRRNPEFTPGSLGFLRHMLDTDLDFVDTFSGAIVIQAVGKGGLVVFERTGKKTENSQVLNHKLLACGRSQNMPVELKGQSPNADNLSFLSEGLEATVLARYHEGSWHKMQTKDDDFSNVNVRTVDETIDFLTLFLKTFNPEDV